MGRTERAALHQLSCGMHMWKLKICVFEIFLITYFHFFIYFTMLSQKANIIDCKQRRLMYVQVIPTAKSSEL
jgi:hypothetical protein